MNTSDMSSNPIDWSALPPDERAKAQEDEARVRGGFWRKLKGGAARVPFASDALAAYYTAFDRETPLRVRAGFLAALAYFVLPIDGIPDLLPMIGLGDDALVLMGAIKMLAGHIKPHHYDAAQATLKAARDEA